MKLKLFITILALFIIAGSANAAKTFKSEIETKRIPAGTSFKIQLLDPISTKNGQTGDYFSAVLLDEQQTGSKVILPAGSIIRGSIQKVKPSKRLSRGAILYLDFDHIVTTAGRQLPLDMVITGKVNVSFDGGIYTDLGYGEALQKNWDKTVEITSNVTEKGIDLGDDYLNGYAKIFTVPIYAIGGAFGGGAYLLGDSVVDLFRKGSDVIFNQGEILTVLLTQPIDVPLN